MLTHWLTTRKEPGLIICNKKSTNPLLLKILILNKNIKATCTPGLKITNLLSNESYWKWII